MPYDRVVDVGISTHRVGAGNMMGQTLFADDSEYHEPPSVDDAGEAVVGGSPQFSIIGFIGLLVLLWFVREQSGHLQQQAFGLNFFNLLVITITAIVGIVLFKLAFNRFPIPGVTAMVNAV